MSRESHISCTECLDKMDAFRKSRLSATEMAAMQEHLDSCPDCQKELEFRESLAGILVEHAASLDRACALAESPAPLYTELLDEESEDFGESSRPSIVSARGNLEDAPDAPGKSSRGLFPYALAVAAVILFSLIGFEWFASRKPFPGEPQIASSRGGRSPVLKEKIIMDEGIPPAPRQEAIGSPIAPEKEMPRKPATTAAPTSRAPAPAAMKRDNRARKLEPLKKSESASPLPVEESVPGRTETASDRAGATQGALKLSGGLEGFALEARSRRSEPDVLARANTAYEQGRLEEAQADYQDVLASPTLTSGLTTSTLALIHDRLRRISQNGVAPSESSRP